jgi:Na+-transporting NADH:ubiquinone oxidoreductase subunit B
MCDPGNAGSAFNRHRLAGAIGGLLRPRSSSARAMVTHTGPHLRDSMNLPRLRLCMVIALAPCVLIAIYNTGHQAGLGMSRLGLDTLPGWRGALLETLGLGGSTTGTAAAIMHGLLYVLPILGIAFIVGNFWRQAFARLRGREAGDAPIVTALIFTLILPPGAPLWQVALGMSFGLVIGKEIFGGTGKNFMNPALVGLAFLYLAYPNGPVASPIWAGAASYGGTGIFGQIAGGGMDALARAGLTWRDSFIGFEPDVIGVSSAAACLIGAAVLIVTGAASWRIMLAVLTGGVVAALLVNFLGRDAGPIFSVPWYWHLTLGGFAFGSVFLAADPVSAASTNAGRWIYGLLIGAMIVLVRVANPIHPDGVLMAVLLGNVFAPLIDYGVVWANIRRRARRYV